MAKVITQLYEKGNHAVEIYPNIARENIPNDAITTDKIVDESITADKISSSAVTSDKLDSGAVTTSKLGFGAVTGDNIDYKTITSDNIQDGEVKTINLEDGAVTKDKLAFNLYYYTGTIATSTFYITFELYSITNLDVNTASTSDFLKLLYENRKDATIYMAGHDISNNTLKVYRVYLPNDSTININSVDETANIDIQDVIKTPIFH